MMKSSLQKLSEKYNLEIIAPFSIKIKGEIHSFYCLFCEYGAKNGMIIDRNWGKIEPVQQEILMQGYGFSCLEINIENQTDLDVFDEVLKDWGKVN